MVYGEVKRRSELAACRRHYTPTPCWIIISSDARVAEAKSYFPLALPIFVLSGVIQSKPLVKQYPRCENEFIVSLLKSTVRDFPWLHCHNRDGIGKFWKSPGVDTILTLDAVRDRRALNNCVSGSVTSHRLEEVQMSSQGFLILRLLSGVVTYDSGLRVLTVVLLYLWFMPRPGPTGFSCSISLSSLWFY
jgi:hypothetical protein